MRELEFPVLAFVFVFVVIVPLLTLASRTLLRRRTHRAATPHAIGTHSIYMHFVLPVLAPVLWLSTAAVAALTTPGGGPCLREHGLAEWANICLEPALFATLLVGSLSLVFMRKERVSSRSLCSRGRVGREAPSMQRIAALAVSRPALRELRGRLVAVDHGEELLSTRGWLRPRIYVHTELARELDDSALAAALLHEAEHARALDPARFLLASVCLSINPVAFLLQRDYDRWRFARELVCDQGAVDRGADPAALAHAIVIAARPRPIRRRCIACLCDGGIKALELRVAFLLDRVSAPNPAPMCASDRPVVPLAVTCALLIVLAVAAGSGSIDALHIGAETTIDWILSRS